MPTFRLARLSAVDLVFDGELLADASTFEDGKPRWQEVRVYVVTGKDKWVVERMGRTTRANEVDRPLVTVAESPEEVRLALETTQDGRTFTTDVCYDALNAAAEKDPRLADALVERL